MPWVAPPKYFDMHPLEDIQTPFAPKDDLNDLSKAGKIFAHYHAGINLNDPTDHRYITSQPDLWKRAVRAYLACSSFTDGNVGTVLNALENSKYRDNTIVVIWSDHGWHLGEKEHWRKMALWEASTRVLFQIRTAGMKSSGHNCYRPVNLQDIYPTLQRLCNLMVNQTLDGNDLTPLLQNPHAKWEYPSVTTYGLSLIHI